MGDELTLTDEQIDLLYLSQKVVDARRAFTKRLAEGFRTNDQTKIDEGDELKTEYEKIFAEQLKFVVENPPQPKAKPVISYTGFARRA